MQSASRGPHCAHVHEAHGGAHRERTRRAPASASGPLQRQQGAVIKARDLAAFRERRAQIGFIGIFAGSIGDDQKTVSPASRSSDRRECRPDRWSAAHSAGGHSRDRARSTGTDRFQCSWQRRRCSRCARARELAHMRDVEQAGGRAHMQVLLQNAGRVLHRHLIAGERHHACAKLDDAAGGAA